MRLLEEEEARVKVSAESSHFLLVLLQLDDYAAANRYYCTANYYIYRGVLTAFVSVTLSLITRNTETRKQRRNRPPLRSLPLRKKGGE
jgi:hypothetical protein